MSTIQIDKNRFLVKEASPEKISGKWREVVDEIIKTCKEHLDSHLISIYVGGSVAYGTAIENKSDVDTYVIVDLCKEEIKKLHNTWIDSERKRIDSLFTFQRGIEIHPISVNQIGEGKKFQMKVLSALAYGKDLSSELPEYKLDKETLGRIRVNLLKDIDVARMELEEISRLDEIKKINIWISKRLIRSAGMMCMWRGDFFTMDVTALTKMFASYYPEKKKEIEELLDYTKNPPSNKQIMFDIFNLFGSWLVTEDTKVFSS